MRAIVTGANGFVGGYVVRELIRADYRVVGTDRTDPNPKIGSASYVRADVTDRDAMTALIRANPPDVCIHLAGLAALPSAAQDPPGAYDVNTMGTIRLLDAVRRHAPAARVLVVTSALVYGVPTHPGPVSEDDPLRPDGIYAATKAAADQATLLLARGFGLHFMTARPTNHIGPGQSPSFVVPAFAQQLNRLRRGSGEPRLRVGNLDSRRDFLDVRDVARAYRLLLEKGRPATAYNIASGQSVDIRTLLEVLCRITGVHPELEIDPDLYRPTDPAVVLDAGRIGAHTGWRPEVPLEQSLLDVAAEQPFTDPT